MQLKSEEDYKFLGTILFKKGGAIEEVPCKLFLPKTVRDKPVLVTQLDNSLWNRVAGSYADCSIVGEGAGGTRFEARGGYIGGGHQRIWFDDRLTEGYAIVNPAEIEITSPFSGTVDPSVTFNCTDSLLLSPRDLRTFRRDGSVSVEKGETFDSALTPEISLRFENSYSVTDNEDNTSTIRRELVARASLSRFPPDKSPRSLLPLLDDLLLLLALAEGRRCGCMSASWIRDEESVQLLRLDRTVPKELPKHSMNDVFVFGEIKEFLEAGYEVLRSEPKRETIYAVLATLTFDDETTTTTRFLRYFAAFESLVLAYRRERGLEFILDSEKERGRLEKDLKKVIRQHELLAGDSSARKMLYENLLGIHRVSLRRAAEAMLDEEGIQVDDIWPLFDSSDGWSLATIRNKLVHGESFNEVKELVHIAKAESSIRKVTVRVLLKWLGWDFQRTRAAWPSRSQRWKESRAALSKR